MDRVTAAARGHPAAVAELVRELVEAAPDVGPDAGRGLEVGQGVEEVGVAAVLGHQHRGLEAVEQRRHHGIEAGQPGFVPGVGRIRQVGLCPAAGAGAGFARKPRPREQVPAGLVEADGHHLRVGVEDVLGAVAVVNVDVDIGHAVAAFAQPGDGDGGVVVDTEA